MKKDDMIKNRTKNHTELRKQSFEQSGVKKMIPVYNLFRESHKANQVHQLIKSFNYAITCSNSLEPKLFLSRN